MKKMIASLLALAMMLALCPPAFAADWFLPDGVPMYEPACVMELDFGTLTILQAGFTKQVQCGFSPDRKDDSYEVNKRYYYNAKDGFALFAVKGILHNDSDSSIELGPLQPKVSYGPGDEQWAGLYGYTNVPVGSPEERSLEPAHDVEIVYATQVPGAMYFGNTDLLMELGGSQLGFLREDLKCYERIGFNAGDGEPAGDITMMTVDEQKPAEPKQADGTEADFFTFSDPKIVPAKKDGMYVLDFMFTCLYPERSGETYPTTFDLRYSLLDEEHIAVKSGYLHVNNNIFYGEKARASACQFFEADQRLIFQDELAEIKYVRFTGCEVTTPIEGSYNIHLKEYTFKTRQDFPLFEEDITEIDRALLGTWSLPGFSENEFLFADGVFGLKTGDSILGGTYVINLVDSTIDLEVQATDGRVKSHLPFSFNGGVLTLMNNDNTEMVRTNAVANLP